MSNEKLAGTFNPVVGVKRAVIYNDRCRGILYALVGYRG